MWSVESKGSSAVHRRMALACDAARTAGLPGSFRAWTKDGLLAVRATDSELSFLSTMAGLAPETVTAAIDLANDSVWGGMTPTLIVPQGLGDALGTALLAAKFVRSDDRIMAVHQLDGAMTSSKHRTHLDVVETDAGADDFISILLAGYEVQGAVAGFISAEHRHPTVQRFLALERAAPIAAAAMTVHDGVAVLGGAATLPAHRGKGAQSLLLQHRLRKAADAGCSLAVATARPDSVSASNLRTAGFRIYRQTAWTKH